MRGFKSFVGHKVNAAVLALAAGGGAVVAGARGLRWSAIGQGLLILLAAGSFVCLRRLREIRAADHHKHGTATAWWHLAATNCAALAYAWFMFDGYGEDHISPAKFNDFGSAAKDWMLASGLVGGTLAIFRSSATNSAALAALRQSDGLRDEIVRLRQRLGDASDLTGLALDAAQSPEMSALLALLDKMVTLASDLPETSDAVDVFSVWIRDEATWRIIAGRGVSERTLTNFRQPVLARVQVGQGIVANLAASGERQFIRSTKAHEHEWYATDSDSTRTTEGFAAILLVDSSGAARGALCLTSEAADGIPGAERAEELQRFEKVLNLWSAAFRLPVLRYFELLDGG